MCTDHDVIKGHIVKFYEDLSKFSWRPKLDGLPFEYIDQSSSSWLDRPFEADEVF